MDFKKILSLIGKFKGTIGVLGIVPTIIGGTFYFLTWLDGNYASAETVFNLETTVHKQEIQQVSFEKKLDDINLANRISRLEDLLEETGDKMYELKRRIHGAGADAREEDRQQLDRLERRVERYERDLERLNPSE